jgi:hypothetical protein
MVDTPRVTVPVEPTEAMMKAADAVDWNNEDERASVINMWQAMLSAAPAPEGGAVDDRLHSAISKLKDWVGLIQLRKNGGCVSGNPIVDCVNDLPAIIRELEAAELEIEGAFERYEDALATREEAPAGSDHPCYDEHQPGCDCVIPAQKVAPVPSFLERMTAPAEAGETIEARFPELNDDLIRMASTGSTGSLIEWGAFIERLKSALRAQPPAREDGDDRPIEASWTDGVTHAYVNLSAALSAERQAWRQKLGIRIASVRYLDVEVPPAREDAQLDTDCVSLLADLDAGKPCGPEAAATIRSLIRERDTTPPASEAEKLRVAVEALTRTRRLVAEASESGFSDPDTVRALFVNNGAITQALAALQAEQKGGA